MTSNEDTKKITKYLDYICGTKIQSLADVIISPNGLSVYQNNYIVGKLIVYCHTHHFRYCLESIEKLKDDVILITHNSDGAVKSSKDGQRIGENDADFDLLPDNVSWWFAQNIELESVSKRRITPLPIGLENRYCFPYDKAESLFFMEQNNNPARRIYLNFNVNTNPHERNAAFNVLTNHVMSDKIAVRMGANGDNYQNYLNDVNNNLFILSPRGNGLDCHRTWEALSLGRIPIMKRTPSISELVSSLPVILVDSWDEVYGLNLNYHQAFESLDYRKLWMPYWRFKIEHKAGRNIS